jgi:hypothetical protein
VTDSHAGVLHSKRYLIIDRDTKCSEQIRRRFGMPHLEEDAMRFMLKLNSRLAEFDLEAEPTKTRLLRFDDQARARCKQEGLRRPQTFNVLGLTHFVGRSSGGRFVVGRRTQHERARASCYATFAKVRATMVGIVTDPRRDASPAVYSGFFRIAPSNSRSQNGVKSG